MRATSFLAYLFALALLLSLLGFYHVSSDEEATNIFMTAGECSIAHGVYRWDVKTDAEQPPDHIPKDHQLQPSDIADWQPPRGVFTRQTPRSGKEKEWYSVTGRLVKAIAEADGDLHIQLMDRDGKNQTALVCELPAKQSAGVGHWDHGRRTIFDLTTCVFPFSVHGARNLVLMMNSKPLLRLEGRAFWDGQHAGQDTKPNRRPNQDCTVWEIHPVMMVEVLKE